MFKSALVAGCVAVVSKAIEVENFAEASLEKKHKHKSGSKGHHGHGGYGGYGGYPGYPTGGIY